MTYPSYPSPAGPSPQLGWYPLRPLGVGEVIGSGLRIAMRHLAVLAPVAVLFVLVQTAVNVLVLASKGVLRAYANGDLTRVPAGATPEQISAFLRTNLDDIFPAVAGAAVVGLVAAPMLAGVAAPFAAMAATSRTGTNSAGLARLRGRWGSLFGVAVIAGLAEAIGLALLVVPGVLIWLIWLPAGPAAAMEGMAAGPTLGRAAVVSKGYKGRLLGVSMLMALIVGAIGFAVAAILDKVIGGDDPVTRLLITQLLAALVSAVLTPWSSMVTAMLYIDIRMRREGLATALLAASRPTYWS